MSRQPQANRRRMLAVAGALVAICAACSPIFGQADGAVRHAVLTGTGGETYSYSSDGTTVLASYASTDTDQNLREVFWKPGDPFYADQQSCAVWNSPAGSTQPGDTIQPGVAMRIAPTGPDGHGVKAITVNENIWYGGVWYFWINLWDSTNTATPFQGLEAFDLSSILGKIWKDDDGFHSTVAPPPWHVCVRTNGLELTFKVWTGSNPEPTWDDPDHAFSAQLPQGWDYAGYSGGYVGHIDPGLTASFSSLTNIPLCLAPDMTSTAECQAVLNPGTTSSTTPSSTAPVTTTAQRPD